MSARLNFAAARVAAGKEGRNAWVSPKARLLNRSRNGYFIDGCCERARLTRRSPRSRTTGGRGGERERIVIKMINQRSERVESCRTPAKMFARIEM